MKQINIKHITHLHSDALRGLDFYEQELSILQERLEEITADNTSPAVLEKIDHFQDQFIVHQRYIDDLRYNLHKNLKNIEEQIIENAGFIDKIRYTENKNLYEQYVTEEKIFNELRHEFNRFAAEWM
jgi:metal-dependent hydrolase (beta-lactamase superfamily II)